MPSDSMMEALECGGIFGTGKEIEMVSWSIQSRKMSQWRI